MTIQPGAPLRRSPEKQIGVSIPTPLDARLDALVRTADGAGENTSRKELLAALLLVAPEDPEQLIQALRAYRMAEARAAAIADEDPMRYLEEPLKRPGPRPRRTQG